MFGVLPQRLVCLGDTLSLRVRGRILSQQRPGEVDVSSVAFLPHLAACLRWLPSTLNKTGGRGK